MRSAHRRSPDELPNTGWVRHTVESALWGVLTTGTYGDAVIAVANLGADADTAAAVTGAIAGAAYGVSGIPAEWQERLRGRWPVRDGREWRAVDFIRLANRLVEART